MKASLYSKVAQDLGLHLMQTLKRATRNEKKTYLAHMPTVVMPVERLFKFEEEYRDKIVCYDGEIYPRDLIASFYDSTPIKGVITSFEMRGALEGHELHTRVTFAHNDKHYSFSEMFTCDWIHGTIKNDHHVHSLVGKAGNIVTVLVNREFKKAEVFGVWGPHLKHSFRELFLNLKKNHNPSSRETIAYLLWDSVQALKSDRPRVFNAAVTEVIIKLKPAVPRHEVMTRIAAMIRLKEDYTEYFKVMLPHVGDEAIVDYAVDDCGLGYALLQTV